MRAFISPLAELAEFETVRKKRREKAGMIQLAGCVNSQKTHMMYALGDGFDFKIIATSSEMKAKQINHLYYHFFQQVIYHQLYLLYYNLESFQMEKK